MKRLILALLLLFPAQGWGAAITSKVVGTSGSPALASVATSWVGDVAPVDGDTIIVASGAYIQQDVARTYGSNVAAVGHGVTIQATNASTYGTLTVASGVTLTLRGFNQTTDTAMTVNQYGKFQPASGSTVLIDSASDNQTIINNNGRIVADGVTFGIPSTNISWNNASGDQTITNKTPSLFERSKSIYMLKLFKGATVDPGPIANAAGNGLGAFGDSSVTITSSTNGPVSGQEVATYSAITNNGDYQIDYSMGVMYYKAPLAGNISVVFSYKHASWFGSGISSQANTAGSSIRITNSVINWWGSSLTQSNEYSGGAIMARYKSTTDSDREISITSNTFNYCSRPIQSHNTTTNSSNYLVFSGNTFNYCRHSIGFFDALFNIGYTSYFDINGNTFNSFAQISPATNRSSSNVNQYVRNNTGRIQTWKIMSNTVFPGYFENNTLVGFGGILDSAAGGVLDVGGFEFEGTAAGSMYYRNNHITAGHRAVRYGNYMVVQNNTFDRFYHHGIVHRSTDGYITGYVCSGNIVTDSSRDMAGGWTLGYNRTHWIHDVEIANNTFDTGIRSVNFNDAETTIALGTRLRIYNNSLTSSAEGIIDPADSSSNITKLALERMDYNNDYGNTATPSNIKQATFIKSGAEYHINARNINGVYLHSPSYALPQAGRDLVMTVTGTPGTDLSVTLAWGGGTPVELVAAQGTATGGTAATTHATPGTLVKTGAGWATTYPTWHKTRQVKITSGTGNGQHAMVKSNTADTLTVLPNNIAGTWTAPDGTSVFVIFESEATLTDSASGTVRAGIYSPDLTVAAGTYTDAGISIESHSMAVDPQYNASFAPANQALLAGFGGTFIGAVTPQQTISPSINKKPNFGFNFKF